MKNKIKNWVEEAKRRESIVAEQFGGWAPIPVILVFSNFMIMGLLEHFNIAFNIFLKFLLLFGGSLVLFPILYFKWAYELAMIRKHKDRVNKMFEKMRLPDGNKKTN